ncbi:hypothetical protein RhiLY_05881 [Ceratobasidium sp. AG-Ba]|nr:hypothetical protein RhiLY_05881 [Ceratobasidium sp. AG-Ba]
MDSSSGSSMENALPNIALHLLAVKYVLVASFVILVYDHSITLSEEVRMRDHPATMIQTELPTPRLTGFGGKNGLAQPGFSP